jgi:hypothetical protein
MEMDEEEANAVDVPIDEEPELDPSELLDLEFEEDEDSDDINAVAAGNNVKLRCKNCGNI